MDYTKALHTAAAMCSKKEYCSSEIRKKLQLWEIGEEKTERIISFLKEHKFLDESRFATFYARDKFKFNRWGKQKIAQMLKQKEIPSDIITQALLTLESEEYTSTCLNLLRQKRKNIKDTDPLKEKAKLFRFGLSRGFDYGTIQQCYEKLKKE